MTWLAQRKKHATTWANIQQNPTHCTCIPSCPTDLSSHLFYDAPSSICSPDMGTGYFLRARMGSIKRRPRTAGPAAPASVPVHSFSVALCIDPIDRARSRASVRASAYKTLYVVSAQRQLSDAAPPRPLPNKLPTALQCRMFPSSDPFSSRHNTVIHSVLQSGADRRPDLFARSQLLGVTLAGGCDGRKIARTACGNRAPHMRRGGVISAASHSWLTAQHEVLCIDARRICYLATDRTNSPKRSTPSHHIDYTLHDYRYTPLSPQ
jgi:hypothetical protein